MKNHPYQVMRDLTDSELDELRQSIIENGVLTPLIYDEHNNLIDGHHRSLIIEELGLKEYPRIVHAGLTEEEKLRFARDINVARRHLSNDEKRTETVKRLIKQPDLSDRQIAKQVGASNTFVSNLRKELEESGQLSTVDSSIGADGKKRIRPVFAYNERQMRAALTPGVPERLTADDTVSPVKAKRRINAEEKAKRKDASGILMDPSMIRLIQADIRELYPMLPSNSVHLCLTDAPFERAGIELHKCLAEVCARVLVDGGSLLCATGNCWLPEALYELLGASPLRYHHLLALLTPGAAAPLRHKRVSPHFLPIFWFVKGIFESPDWFTDVYHSPPYGETDDKQYHPHGKNVTAFMDLVERFSNPGETVLDCFNGGGTTAIASIYKNRRYIGCEIKREYLEATQQRIMEEFDMWVEIE